jgi:pyridoxamine 5'-phosphate oxidase
MPLLDELAFPPEPLALLAIWRDEAVAAGEVQPSAMTLATADAAGVPSARTVLATEITPADGITFHSSAPTRKVSDLSGNPRAAGVFAWHGLQRQAVASGTVRRLDDATVDAAFARRPRPLQLLAWLYEEQPARTAPAIQAAYDAIVRRHAHRDVPRPPTWTGFVLTPHEVLFWQRGDEASDQSSERVRYTRAGATWQLDRLLP